jgi:hypothetical protein
MLKSKKHYITKSFLSNILSFKKTPLSLCALNERFLDTSKNRAYTTNNQHIIITKQIFIYHFSLHSN